jgi:hypothetical protein
MTNGTPDQTTFDDHLPRVVRLTFRALCSADNLERVEQLIEQLTLDANGFSVLHARDARPREAASAYVLNALLAAVAEYHELRSLDADVAAAAKESMSL